MREQERAPRTYELMTILHPEVEDEALPGELDRIQGYIAGAGGELIESLRDSPWGRRRLAYPIRSGGKDVRDGYYTVWHFSLAPNRVDELERELKLNPQVIRYLVVSWEPKPLGPEEIEAAEIAAEEAAAAEYAAAQAAAQATETAEATETAAATERAEALTAEAEAIEATGAELAIEPVTAVEEREELEAEAAAALAKAEAAAAGGAAPAIEPEGAAPEGAEAAADSPTKDEATQEEAGA